jgi:phosphate transport system permease protein
MSAAQTGARGMTASNTSIDLRRNRNSRRALYERVFKLLGLLSISIGLGTLAWLLIVVVLKGVQWLDWQFLTSFDSRFPDRAGAKAAIVGTLYTIGICIFVTVPLGVASAIYLEKYRRDTRFDRMIEVSVNNLSAVPSIIYGLLGLQVFARWLLMGRSVMTGALTLALLVLPIVIVAAREAIRAVPDSLSQASYGLGATKWQTIRWHVLPVAMPGVLTGSILAASRAIGESAPLITIGALTFVPFLPRNVLDVFTVMPIQIFNWTSRPNDDFRGLAAAGIIVLMLVLLTLNSVAILMRGRLRRRFRGL